MTLSLPIWLQDKTYTARDDRRLMSMFLAEAQGVLGSGMTISPGTGLTVIISAGYAAVKGTRVAGQGMYLIYNDAPVTVTIAAAGGAQRVDTVILRMYDFTEIVAAGGSTSGLTEGAAFEVLTGGGTVPADSMVIGFVTVPASASSIAPANIVNSAPSYSNVTRMAGEIIMWALLTIPRGWLPCDGAAISRTTYAGLFALLGTYYGVGDGSTTFNIPNMSGRFALGAGAGAGLTARSLGDKVGGEETHIMQINEMPNHSHFGRVSINVSATDGTLAHMGDLTGGVQDTQVTTKVGGDAPHNNMPPFLAVNYIIKT